MSEPLPEARRKKENVLTRKIGPLPTWAWVAIVAAVIIGWAYFRARKQSQQANQQGSTAPASDIPQFVNQTYTTVMPPAPPQPPPGKHDGTGSGSSGSGGSEGGGEPHRKHPRRRHHPTHHPRLIGPPERLPPGPPDPHGPPVTLPPKPGTNVHPTLPEPRPVGEPPPAPAWPKPVPIQMA